MRGHLRAAKVMRGAAIAAILALALAGCREGAEAPPPPLASETLALECLRSGGEMARAGTVRLCVKQTRDGGRSCTKATDCQGDCLARSRSCSPLTPLQGCHEILTSEGVRATQCRE